ncbi:MAG: hypothetical protein CME19_11450 [Gemmatimonadetes bacterium]|nr:hypothetical protein [Gemmatimonadota bacterium]
MQGAEANLYVSRDGADSFERKPLWDQPTEVRTIALDHTNHLRQFAATDDGVYLTADAGET